MIVCVCECVLEVTHIFHFNQFRISFLHCHEIITHTDTHRHLQMPSFYDWIKWRENTNKLTIVDSFPYSLHIRFVPVRRKQTNKTHHQSIWIWCICFQILVILLLCLAHLTLSKMRICCVCVCVCTVLEKTIHSMMTKYNQNINLKTDNSIVHPTHSTQNEMEWLHTYS